jgi:hypothetical protein
MSSTDNKKRFIALCEIELEAGIREGLLKRHDAYELLCEYTTQVRKTLTTWKDDESLFNGIKTVHMIILFAASFVALG